MNFNVKCPECDRDSIVEVDTALANNGDVYERFQERSLRTARSHLNTPVPEFTCLGMRAMFRGPGSRKQTSGIEAKDDA